MASEEYDANEDDEVPDTVEPMASANRSSTLDSQNETKGSPKEKAVTPKVEQVADMDPELAEWFKVDNKMPDSSDERDSKGDDSVTEDDSDNADVADEEVDLDDWFQVNTDKEVLPSEKVAGKQAVVSYDC